MATNVKVNNRRVYSGNGTLGNSDFLTTNIGSHPIGTMYVDKDTGTFYIRNAANETSDDWQAADAGGSSYFVYTALLNQTGISAPAATVLENTLGGSVVWSRTGVGDYLGTLSGAFTDLKTLCFITVGNSDPLGQDGFWIIFYRNNANTVRMQCFGFAGGTIEPRELNSGATTSIKIEVYP